MAMLKRMVIILGKTTIKNIKQSQASCNDFSAYLCISSSQVLQSPSILMSPAKILLKNKYNLKKKKENNEYNLFCADFTDFQLPCSQLSLHHIESFSPIWGIRLWLQPYVSIPVPLPYLTGWQNYACFILNTSSHA